jgi:hypothetical protein
MVHHQTGATVIGIAGGCFNSPIQIAELLGYCRPTSGAAA